ncbi:alpha/beta fold hydrolase [Lutibaculum baratangense]|uniref:Hydrolase n=1 Tax=Lutibaculum baratangense AMV1 TaxID=631454 RepID=V4TGA2_9HYPH|nr:alpha/beta hydrolase [Lutibaculum baratangense]ESR25148.1 Hydrolase [Lutibaculum baratangense AMV1]
MQHFDSDGVDIAYDDVGEGAPILLIHGFASNSRVNWVDTGWVKDLVRAGRRVVTVDNRGHGESEKLYDPEMHGSDIMAEDADRLLRHLEIEKADVVGYSMGARIAAFLAMRHPERVQSVVFSGLGINMIRGVGESEPIARALEAEDASGISDPNAWAFRKFADQTKSDRKALAACIRSARQPITEEQVATIQVPVLVAVGSGDDVGGSAEELSRLIPNGQAFVIEGRNHMQAVGDRTHKAAVLEFLRDHGLGAAA